jgi:deoxyribose-phosphate aldolase
MMTTNKNWHEMASRIDYSDLRVDTQERDLRLLCLEAEKFHIPTVVVNPVNVKLASKFARGTKVKIATVVSYPVGAYSPAAKELEILDAIEDGADEIYMVMAVGAYLNGWKNTFTDPEMKILTKTSTGKRTTLITEACVLTDEQKKDVVKLAINAGIGFLAAGAGFVPSKLPDPSNAELETLVKCASGKIGIVFMGEVGDKQRADELFDLGIDHICTPNARMILAGFSDFPGKA